MIAELIQQGFFKQVTTEGRTEYVLNNPIQIVLKSAVLKQLKSIYKLHEETGGILYAKPVGKNLVINSFKELPNTLTGAERKTAYKPSGSSLESSLAVVNGFLPIRFHSHPVEIFDSTYDKQPLSFFQKTSNADRHNSYLPLSVQGFSILLPDGLLSANDRAGTDIRFYVYGGLVAPDSLKALLTSEKIYVYFSIIAVLLTAYFGSFKRAWSIFLIAAVFSVVVFLIEKRPDGVINGDGDLIISIP